METLLHGFKRSILALFLFFVATFFAKQSLGQGSQTFNTPGTFTFTVPAGINSITVTAWGAGGAGGGVVGEQKGGGGGAGGAFVRGTITVIPGTQYTVVVGSGGTGSNGNGTNGGASSFGTTIFNAVGGAGGAVGNTHGAGGLGGSTGNLVSGTSTVSNYGGNGGTASTNNAAASGGGGGSAGAGGAGGNGAPPNLNQATGGAGAAGPAGSPSAPGATGGNGRGQANDGNGFAGGSPGAGGGGARNANDGTTYIGGNGANGQVIVTVNCPTDAGTLSGTQAICFNATTTFNSTLVGGSWTSSDNGIATIHPSTGLVTPVTAGTATMTYTLAPAGCTVRTATQTVTINALPTTSAAKSDVQCFNTSTGSIVVTGIGGASPYTFSINNGSSYQASNTFNNLPVSAYQIRVKDNNGCESKSVQ